MTTIRRLYVANMQLVALMILGFLFVIHPMIHHTPLDSGALDAFFAQLHLFAGGILSSK